MNNHLGFGFSYVFRKKVWEAIPFSDDSVHWNEDTPFAVAADKVFRLLHFKDRRGLCLHVLHEGNISRSFPQYRLPSVSPAVVLLPRGCATTWPADRAGRSASKTIVSNAAISGSPMLRPWDSIPRRLASADSP